MPTMLETYTFSELAPDAQETALEHVQEKLAEWIEPEEVSDHDYWIERFFTPYGIAPEYREWQNPSGYRGKEPEIFWETYPTRVYFDADIPDMAETILAFKLGNRCRTLLHHARRNEVWGHIRYPDIGRWNSGASVEYSTSGYDPREFGSYPRYVAWESRLAQEAEVLQSVLDDWYADTCDEIAGLVQSAIDYLYSDEYAREWLDDNPDYFVFDVEGVAIR